MKQIENKPVKNMDPDAKIAFASRAEMDDPNKLQVAYLRLLEENRALAVRVTSLEAACRSDH